MIRREFCEWLARMAGICSVAGMKASAIPLIRINTTRMTNDSGTVKACGEDTCSSQDNCGASDTAGHTCQTRDVCDVDQSGDCTDDACTSDASKSCQGDRCTVDSSGECTNDGGPLCQEDCLEDQNICCSDWTGYCQSDSSGSCTNDGCLSDSSGDCQTDFCTSDSSGLCSNDCCGADSSDTCTNNDWCVSDKSGQCPNTDSCISDKSGDCITDFCESDSSKSCTDDHCISDSSKDCETDGCSSDTSDLCEASDTCVLDASGACSVLDACAEDSSDDCQSDTCISDSSGSCGSDSCNSDLTANCVIDICILDVSNECKDDMCREDRNSVVCETDSCALDFKNMGTRRSRRSFTSKGINQAIRWLYRISVFLLILHAFSVPLTAQIAIDATNAVFFPEPGLIESGSVMIDHPAGPFLRDCDSDGILEADVNGDGLCLGDPEIRDYNEDGSMELPTGTAFTGEFEYTCFHIPDDVMIESSGPLTIRASMEFVVYGAVRIAGNGVFAAACPMDLRMSAWRADGTLQFTTVRPGQTSVSQTPLPDETALPDMPYTSTCEHECTTTGVTLWMPLDEFHADDTCSCYAFVCNAESQTLAGYPLFVILDVLGVYYFAPGFSNFDYYDREFPMGETTVRVLPEFDWPPEIGSFSGVVWWGAMTDPQITRLFGDLDSFVFGWDTDD